MVGALNFMMTLTKKLYLTAYQIYAFQQTLQNDHLKLLQLV